MAAKKAQILSQTPDDHTPPNQNEKVSFDIPQNVSVNEPFEVTIYLKRI